MENQGRYNTGLYQWQALALLILYCLAYRLPLHFSSDATVSPTRSRDNPDVIRARIRLVSYSTTACSVITLIILLKLAPDVNAMRLMGYWPFGLQETAKILLLNSLLFAGPLYECLLVDGTWRDWADSLQPVRVLFEEWTEWRNIVAGPITEECLFRSAAVPLLVLSDMSFTAIVFVSPIIFGLAHLYHFYESRITHPGTPLSVAIIRALVQLTYTTIFGAYATYVYIRTGSLLAAIALHAMCNSLGIRFIWGYAEPYWMLATKTPSRVSLLKWTIPYYILLFGGPLAWWMNLESLTRSTGSLEILSL